MDIRILELIVKNSINNKTNLSKEKKWNWKL